MLSLPACTGLTCGNELLIAPCPPVGIFSALASLIQNHPHLTCKQVVAGSAARKENVRPANGAHRPPDSNGYSKGPEPEPCTLAEVAEPALVRDVLCACQVRSPFTMMHPESLVRACVAMDPPHTLAGRATLAHLLDKAYLDRHKAKDMPVQGFDGQHVRYNPRAVGGLGGFEIAPEAGIPRVQRQLMLRICELGWLFRCRIPNANLALHTPVAY